MGPGFAIVVLFSGALTRLKVSFPRALSEDNDDDLWVDKYDRNGWVPSLVIT